MRKKKFDETNDVSFSVETTEFARVKRERKRKRSFRPKKRKSVR